MAKLYVSGVVAWTWFKAPNILVSVEAADGKPVTGLNKNSFEVGRFGDGSDWVQQKVTSFDGAKGFYQLLIGGNTIGDQTFPWQSYQSNTVFTVAVTVKQDYGQTLALNRCCDDDGTGAKYDRTVAEVPKRASRKK